MIEWPAVAVMAVAFLATVAGTPVFRAFAIKRRIIANPNFRSLHERPMPRAGGVVFSLAFIAGVVALWLIDRVDAITTLAMVVGATGATVFGFIDDCAPVGARSKFAVQGLLAVWILAAFGWQPLVDLPWIPSSVEVAISWLALVWLMNAYNFMDGIDGMATSGAVFLASGAAVSLSLAASERGLICVAMLLAVCSAGFLFFNWPPATIFMGDSGSLCLGCSFGVLLVGTVTTGALSLWTWVVLFGYFGVDTTTTTLLRMFLTRRWYGEHRSHAYQNAARIWNSHLRVVGGVSAYHGLWILPLTIWSVVMPEWAPLAAALAVGPVVVWTLRYGPRLSPS
jgi:Fuc2NAc and GlcNAc transferase